MIQSEFDYKIGHSSRKIHQGPKIDLGFLLRRLEDWKFHWISDA